MCSPRGGTLSILSFVAVPTAGNLKALERELNAIDGCEVLAATTAHDILIVVAEAADTARQEALMTAFARISCLESIALTFASVTATPLETEL